MSRERNMGSNPLQTTYRGIEQQAARVAHNHKVGGSSPSPATKCKCHFCDADKLVLLIQVFIFSVIKHDTSVCSSSGYSPRWVRTLPQKETTRVRIPYRLQIKHRQVTTYRSVRLADTYFGKSGRVAVLRGGWSHGFESRTDYKIKTQ